MDFVDAIFAADNSGASCVVLDVDPGRCRLRHFKVVLVCMGLLGLGGCDLWEQIKPPNPVEPPMCQVGIDADGDLFWDCPALDDED